MFKPPLYASRTAGSIARGNARPEPRQEVNRRRPFAGVYDQNNADAVYRAREGQMGNKIERRPIVFLNAVSILSSSAFNIVDSSAPGTVFASQNDITPTKRCFIKFPTIRSPFPDNFLLGVVELTLQSFVVGGFSLQLYAVYEEWDPTTITDTSAPTGLVSLSSAAWEFDDLSGLGQLDSFSTLTTAGIDLATGLAGNVQIAHDAFYGLMVAMTVASGSAALKASKSYVCYS